MPANRNSSQMDSAGNGLSNGMHSLAGIRDLFAAVGQTFLSLSEGEYGNSVFAAARRISQALGEGRKLLVFGNGGSAADAQHICGELVGRFQKNRRALPAISLSSDTSIVTAWSNDFSFETVFARQIEALGNPGDVALGISTSGNSPNVVRGLETARERGLVTILLTGARPGKACAFSDVVVAAPATATPRIQEIHLVSYHAICEYVEDCLVEEPLRLSAKEL
jgi:D-sedoheptulose 7-phosphate isomerase